MGNLTLTSFTDEKFQDKTEPERCYEAMLNPESVERGASIEYTKKDSGNGTHDSAPQFDDMPCQTLGFELVIDCTGVVSDKRLDLARELDTLNGVLYAYNGTIHRPNFVKVVWGTTLHFKGVLSRMDISYTFFKPDGTALRARVKLQFLSYLDVETKRRKQGKKSPDVTHHLVVREGDSLPLIANAIYGSPAYCVALARANRLDKFRHLPAGTTLLAPPLAPPGTRHG